MATPKQPPAPYLGRFAPSPSGPLHHGSLLAAVASYLDAKAHNGQWYVRIEDIDKPRCVDGATEQILHSLQHHGLHWDRPVEYQREREPLYHQALTRLQTQQQIYYCDCSRRALRQHAGPYPGTCRNRQQTDYRPASADKHASHAIRFALGSGDLHFDDRILGRQQGAATALGDFILRRRDGLYAYQLAVVIDDAEQGVSDIVRGADLLPSTPWQIALQRALGLPQPRYAHLPLLVHRNGDKLSKQTGAAAIDDRTAGANLRRALSQLGQRLPANAEDYSVEQLLDHGSAHWSLSHLPQQPIAH